MKRKVKLLNFILALLIPVYVIFLMAFSFAHSPDDVLQKLKDGNQRFVKNERINPNQDAATLKQTAEKGQFPYATIISCSDSRVPVEHIFDAGFGDLFVIRVAGNVVDIDEAGSIEYGVEHLHTPVLVVLGHTSCGAVTAVCRGDHVNGNISKLVDNIIPAVDKAKKKHGDEFNDEVLNEAIINNVWQSIEDLIKLSSVTTELIVKKELKVIGAIYHLDSGEVEWLGEHPDLQNLLAHSKELK